MKAHGDRVKNRIHYRPVNVLKTSIRLSASCPVRESGSFCATATGDESLILRFVGAPGVSAGASALTADAGLGKGLSTSAMALASSMTWFARSGGEPAMDGVIGCWQPASRSGEKKRINPRGFRMNLGILKAFCIR
jgi:hypothetical protein